MKNKIILTLFLFFFSSLAFADMAIYCPKCKTHLYNYKKELVRGTQIKAEDFEPANKEIPPPVSGDIMSCPLDGAYLNGWEYWAALQNFKSFTFAYRAVSLLSKDENEKWVWVPDVLPMINMNEEK